MRYISYMRYVTRDWIWKLCALLYFLRNEHSFCDLAHAAAQLVLNFI